MAANPIYVETEEEIPELVERLRRYDGNDTMLVSAAPIAHRAKPVQLSAASQLRRGHGEEGHSRL